MNNISTLPYQYVIGIDAHKKFSYITVMSNDNKGEIKSQEKIMHNKDEYQKFFLQYNNNAKATLEATFNWYWMADIIQSYNIELHLSNPKETKAIAHAKLSNDKVDSKMLANLLRTNLLPESYIAPPEIRDKRELLRYRMYLSSNRTGLKNRIHSILNKYGLAYEYEGSDLFSKSGIKFIESIKSELPEYTKKVLEMHINNLNIVIGTLKEIEEKIKEIFKSNKMILLLNTIPGVGDILAIVIYYETGEIERFRSHESYCYYSGTVPSGKISAGKIYSMKLSPACNHYLRWAYVEAANAVISTKCDENLVIKYNEVKARRGSKSAKMVIIKFNTK